MRTLKKEVEFTTFAFLTGGNQNQADLRGASIRGELRWWFRVLGATREQEASVFGGIGDSPTASKVIVRASIIKHKKEQFPDFKPMSPFGYLAYFAKASGAKEGVRRTSMEASFAPGTSFDIEIIERMPLAEDEFNRLEAAVDCLVRIGSLGLRARRSFGAMNERELMSKADFVAWTKKLPKQILVRAVSDQVYSSAFKVQSDLGGFLQELRSSLKVSSKRDSALGYGGDGNRRTASALRLRPVRVKEGYLPVVVYTDAACQQASREDDVIEATRAL